MYEKIHRVYRFIPFCFYHFREHKDAVGGDAHIFQLSEMDLLFLLEIHSFAGLPSFAELAVVVVVVVVAWAAAEWVEELAVAVVVEA